MSDFRFLHAADIHLDSPLQGLARYDGVPLEEVRGATRAAFDGLVSLALTERVDFIVLAGDLFDGDWKDMGTGLYFARAMGRLAKAGISAFVLAGNHDAASVLTKALPWPESVKVFGSRRPETFSLPELGVVLHGQSFATQHVYDDLASRYPPLEPGAFNIGVLHTALGGAEGHAPYAPSSVAALQAKGYDYWALGHVHDFQRVSERPLVVFPGNLQGRNIRETGPKGAVLVEVQGREVADVQFMPLDVVRWSRVRVDCTGASSLDSVHAAVRQRLSEAHGREAEGRPLIVRVELEGEAEIAGALRDRAGLLRAEVQSLAAAVAPDLWLEKLNLHVHPPRATTSEALPDDLLALLAEAPDDPDLAASIAEDLRAFLNARSSGEDGESGELSAAATGGDWVTVLRTAAETLPARLRVRES
jgi:DNA repair exonuclease SbcCD nuclease subunit